MPDATLVRTLSEIQRRGAIGRTSIPDAIDHSARFVAALPPDTRALVDLGSGGGLPGLVIADRRRDVQVILVERRAKRADLLRYGVRSLGLSSSVAVVELDVVRYSAELSVGDRADVVTARSFGPAPTVLDVAAAILRPGGTVLISEPPSGAPAAEYSADRRYRDDGSADGIHRYVLVHGDP